jgi:hypothetical protein
MNQESTIISSVLICTVCEISCALKALAIFPGIIVLLVAIIIATPAAVGVNGGR